MKNVLIPIGEGFEEIETITIIEVLRRAGVRVTVASLKPGPVKGSRRISIMADAELEDVKDKSYDMIILPGGSLGVDKLRQDSRVIALLKKMNEAKLPIAAICAAPLALRDAGILPGRTITSHPSVEERLGECNYEYTRVVIDGNLITSRGPGTAMEFSLKLVEKLVSRERAQEIADAVVLHEAVEF